MKFASSKMLIVSLSHPMSAYDNLGSKIAIDRDRVRSDVASLITNPGRFRRAHWLWIGLRLPRFITGSRTERQGRRW